VVGADVAVLEGSVDTVCVLDTSLAPLARTPEELDETSSTLEVSDDDEPVSVELKTVLE
jgi:hypothetical protein